MAEAMAFKEVVIAPVSQTVEKDIKPLSDHVSEVEDTAIEAQELANKKVSCYYSNTYPDSEMYEEWEPEELEFMADRDRFLRFDGASNVLVWKKDHAASEYNQHIEESDSKGIYAEIITGYDYLFEGSWTDIRSAIYFNGDLWFDTQATALRRWNGTTWDDSMEPILSSATQSMNEYISDHDVFFKALFNLPQHMDLSNGVTINTVNDEGVVEAKMELKGSEIRFNLRDGSFTRMGVGFLQMGDYQVKTYPDKGGLVFFYAPVKEES